MNRQVTTLPVTEKSVANGNWDTSRSPIDRVIIHTMVGTAASANARFNNSTSQVSAHYGVLIDGSIWHWVDEDNTAYHSGNYAMNQRSIGIEHEDNGDYNGTRPDSLYITSAKLVRDICTFYNIPMDRQHILKHSEVIATGCPDALDIDRIVREAASGFSDTTLTIKKSEFDNLMKKATLYDAFAKDNFPDVASVHKAIDELVQAGKDKDNEIFKKTGQIEELTTALATCRNQAQTPPTTQPTPPQTTSSYYIDKLKQINMICNSSWVTYLQSRSRIKNLSK
jgi:hypothetical protein